MESAAAASEPQHPTAEVTGLRQEMATVVAATAATTAVSEIPPAPVPAAVDQAAVVEIPNDDAPPPRWGQWESWPAPAPEPAAGVLLMRRRLHDAAAADARWRAWSRNGSARVRRRPTLARPRPSRRCGKNSTTTAPHSTTR
jgi:hypothetical protein